MAHERQIKLALEEVANSKKPNLLAISKKYNIVHSTLYRRSKGITRSRQDISQYLHRHLTDAQEEVLIKQLNWLSDRGLHATLRIVRNLV